MAIALQVAGRFALLAQAVAVAGSRTTEIADELRQRLETLAAGQ